MKDNKSSACDCGNPEVHISTDGADSEMFTCCHCGGIVCLGCGQVPVEYGLTFCGECDPAQGADDYDDRDDYDEGNDYPDPNLSEAELYQYAKDHG